MPSLIPDSSQLPQISGAKGTSATGMGPRVGTRNNVEKLNLTTRASLLMYRRDHWIVSARCLVEAEPDWVILDLGDVKARDGGEESRELVGPIMGQPQLLKLLLRSRSS